MKYILTTILFLSTFAVQSQRHTKIIVTLPDTSNIYQHTKEALIKNYFQVMELSSKDSIQTYPIQISDAPGYMVAFAAIEGNQITISGVYSFKKMEKEHYISGDAEYKPINNFNKNARWKRLEKIAHFLEGQKRYE